MFHLLSNFFKWEVFLVNKIQEIFQILLRYYDHSQKRQNISFQDAHLLSKSDSDLAYRKEIAYN